MSRKNIKIDFFHDVIWAWCYAISPRVRRLKEEFPDIEIAHHSFALSKTDNDTIRVFGTLENAKKEIMNHWRSSNLNDDEGRINTDLMETREFKYPNSINGLLGCKAAQLQLGQTGHWDYYDLVQKTHLTEARNIGDKEILYDLAEQLDMDREKFIKDFNSDKAKKMVEDDIKLARRLRVNSVPTIIINSRIKVPGAVSYDTLREIVLSEMN